jgi:hypothetical protein
VVAPKAKEPGGGSAPPAGFQSDRFDGRIAASPIPADQIAKRTRVFPTVYSALLAIDDYTEAARAALREGDDDAVRDALEVLRGIVRDRAASQALRRTLGDAAMITVSNPRKINKGALIGFLDVALPSGMKLNGCTLLEKDGKRWIGLPSKEWTKTDGSKSYVPIVEIPDREARDKFNAAVLPAAERALS